MLCQPLPCWKGEIERMPWKACCPEKSLLNTYSTFFKLNKTYSSFLSKITHFVLSSVYIFVISYHQPRKLLIYWWGKFFQAFVLKQKCYVFPLYCIVCILFLFVYGEELTFLFPGRLIEKEPQSQLSSTIIYFISKR